MTFTDKLRTLMDGGGITTEALAQEYGVCRKVIQNYRAGKSAPASEVDFMNLLNGLKKLSLVISSESDHDLKVLKEEWLHWRSVPTETASPARSVPYAGPRTAGFLGQFGKVLDESKHWCLKAPHRGVVLFTFARHGIVSAQALRYVRKKSLWADGFHARLLVVDPDLVRDEFGNWPGSADLLGRTYGPGDMDRCFLQGTAVVRGPAETIEALLDGAPLEPLMPTLDRTSLWATFRMPNGEFTDQYTFFHSHDPDHQLVRAFIEHHRVLFRNALSFF